MLPPLPPNRSTSRVAEECGARLMGVAEEGILEELRARLLEGKGKVAMPQVRTRSIVWVIDRLVMMPRADYRCHAHTGHDGGGGRKDCACM
jgi:hypothetical protein